MAARRRRPPKPYDWARETPEHPLRRRRRRGAVVLLDHMARADGALSMLVRIAGWLGG